MDRDINLKKYIFLLVILLALYFLVDYLPFSKTNEKSQKRELVVEGDIKTLKESTKRLDNKIQADKDSLDNFFYNNKSYSKIDGIIKANPKDKNLKINDNLTLILKKEGYPVKVVYKNAVFDLIDSRANLTDDKNMTLIKDVKVSNNPNEINEYELIHDLKTYLVDAYGSRAFDAYLDKHIKNQIKENEEVIEKISKSYVTTG